ncbi:hypothetical protein DUNSADRAFT_3668 [Dunaliella salina]|uniref:Uncharacterized protein n=1 Tax=Dunaliella salina TaxID=3046 RepID=A0ABQ7GTK9_DUNSA|nr:hypothetical protein DUNSADRAFT_3668 [Dunaliella salina]|eukprot:KAF5837947.1 hypothetical protein DUNSADRAFT_3668 [Dunaliella salina]
MAHSIQVQEATVSRTWLQQMNKLTAPACRGSPASPLLCGGRGSKFDFCTFGLYAAEHQYATAAAHGWPQGAAQHQQQAAAQAAEPKWRVRPRRAEEREVDYVDDAYGEYYPMAAGFEAEAIDEDELEGRKGAAAAAAAAAPLDQGAADKSKAEALSAKQQASKLQSQLAKIQNIMQRKGQDHKEAFAMPPKEAGTPRRGRGGDSTPMRTGEDPALMGMGSKKRQRI